MYWYLRNRFHEAELKSPYGSEFNPNWKQIARVNRMIHVLKGKYGIRIESCAEPELLEAIRSGCISRYDLKLLNLPFYKDDDIPAFPGYQRLGCLCYQGKVELLNSRHPCKHDCLYCYWKRSNESDTT